MCNAQGSVPKVLSFRVQNKSKKWRVLSSSYKWEKSLQKFVQRYPADGKLGFELKSSKFNAPFTSS